MGDEGGVDGRPQVVTPSGGPGTWIRSRTSWPSTRHRHSKAQRETAGKTEYEVPRSGTRPSPYGKWSGGTSGVLLLPHSLFPSQVHHYDEDSYIHIGSGPG